MSLRIGIDATVLHGFYSGVEVAVCGLLAGLTEIDADNEYLVYGAADSPRPEALPSRAHWAPQPFAGAQKLRRIAWQQAPLPRLCRRERLDVLHGPAYVTPIRPSTSTVASVYDLMPLLHPGMCDAPNRLHYRLVLPRCLPRCRRLIVPSTSARRSITELLRVPEERVVVAPLAIDARYSEAVPEAARTRVRGRYGLPERYLLFVGNVEPKKGLPVLLEALSILARDGWELPLVVAGAHVWGAGEFARALERTGVGRLVRAIGYVPLEDLPALYSGARAFVFPSLYEGFGLPPLEAMACGTPVLTTDGGALPETVGDAALVVPAGESQALADGLARIAGDEELRQTLAKRGALRVRGFSWAAHARAVRRAYEGCVDGG